MDSLHNNPLTERPRELSQNMEGTELDAVDIAKMNKIWLLPTKSS